MENFSSKCLKRLQKEVKMLELDPPFHVSASPKDKDNLLEWNAVIVGPFDTPYSGGLFNLDIKFPYDYPFKPPKIKFVTQIFHCNISEKGNICLELLKNKWNPKFSLVAILNQICCLLQNPNPDDPLNVKAAALYKRSKTEFALKAQKLTQENAMK